MSCKQDVFTTEKLRLWHFLTSGVRVTNSFQVAFEVVQFSGYKKKKLITPLFKNIWLLKNRKKYLNLSIKLNKITEFEKINFILSITKKIDYN